MEAETTDDSFYRLRERLEYWKRRVVEDPQLQDDNRRALLAFVEHVIASGRSLVRATIYLSRTYQLAKWLGKSFQEATEQDLKHLMAEHVELNPRFQPGTKEIYRVCLKRAYKFWEGGDKKYPEKVGFITISKKRSTKILPEDLLTMEDVRKLADAANNPRDRCLVMLLFESGCRVGEIAHLKLKHVQYDKVGAILLVPKGKTGARRVRLLFSVNALNTWLENHPLKHEPEAPLWPFLASTNHLKPVDYWAINQALRKLAKRAGITKRVNPHSFRHAAATRLARLGLNESQMEAYLGWVPGTEMTGTYVHLAGRDVDEALLKAYGLQKTESHEDRLPCNRCNETNDVTSKYCRACGQPLTIHAALQIDQKEQEVKQKVERLLEFVKENGLESLLQDKNTPAESKAANPYPTPPGASPP